MKIIIKIRDILIVLILVVGVCFFIGGMVDYYNAKNPIPLESLSSEDVQRGKYVKGIVNEYCGLMGEGVKEEEFIGTSVSYVGFLGIKDFYTIKLKDGKYITLMAEKPETKKTLEHYCNGRGNGTYIEGMITGPVTELNYEWLQNALGQNSREKVEEIVLTRYAIKEHDFSQSGIGMRYGLGFIVSALILIVAEKIEKIIIKKNIVTISKNKESQGGK